MRDGVALVVEHVALLVDDHAAEGAGGGHDELHGVVGRVDDAEAVGAAELRVLLVGAAGLPVVERGLQAHLGQAGLLGQLGHRLALHERAVVIPGLHLVGVLKRGVVLEVGVAEDDPHLAVEAALLAGLGVQAAAPEAVGGVLAGEAVAARAHGDDVHHVLVGADPEVAGVVVGAVEAGLGAQGHAGQDALAGVGVHHGEVVVLHHPVVVRVHVLGHDLVVVDAARAADDALVGLVAGAVEALHAVDGAVLVGEELHDLGVEDDLAALLLNGRGRVVHPHLAAVAVGALGVGRVDEVHDAVGDGLLGHEGHGADAGGGVDLAAEGALDPLERLARLGHEGLHEVLVAVAVGHGQPALLHELDGVVGGDGVGAVVELELVVAHGLEGALGELQGAAGEAGLLKHDDGGAQLKGTVRGVQARAACAADDDVGLVGPLGGGGCLVGPGDGALVSACGQKAGGAGGGNETTARDGSVHCDYLLCVVLPLVSRRVGFSCAAPGPGVRGWGRGLGARLAATGPNTTRERRLFGGERGCLHAHPWVIGQSPRP